MTSRDRNILITALVLMLLLRVGDIYITYLVTPDLSQEWNPLISFFGHSWLGLLIAQVALYLIAVFCVYYSISKNAFSSYKKGLRYSEFVYYHFNGKIDPPKQWVAKFFKLPKFSSDSLVKHFAFICFIYSATFITASLFAVLNNILIYVEFDSYIRFVYRYSNMYILGIFILSIFINAQIYFYWGYSRYKNE